VLDWQIVSELAGSGNLADAVDSQKSRDTPLGQAFRPRQISKTLATDGD
jgi:hypothetical protein